MKNTHRITFRLSDKDYKKLLKAKKKLSISEYLRKLINKDK